MTQFSAAPPDREARHDVVNLGQLLAALKARFGLILGFAFIACVLAVAFVFVVTPRFASETQLLLESRESGFTRTLTERELRGGVFDEQAVASQVQVISSRDVAREVIRRLGLIGNPEFDPLVGPMDPIARIRMTLGASQGAFDGAEEDRIFDNYYSRLTVFQVPRSRVIAIRFASEDPDLAARAANMVAEVYLSQLEEAKTELARAASSWLGTSIEDLRERVSAAEAAVEEFRARSGLFVGGNNATITSQQLSDINTELAQARSAQADAQARARLISDMIAGGRAFEIPDVANNDLIRRLIEQRIAMRSQLALEQRTLLPAHPRILELRAQLTDLDSQIATAAERTVRILENDARLAGSRVESLEAALEAQMRVVAQANESDVSLRALEREARAEREQLEANLARYQEAVARGTTNATLPDARVVSRAVVPQDPVFPRKGPTVVLATLAAIFLAAGGVVVNELAFGAAQSPGTRYVETDQTPGDETPPPAGGRSTGRAAARSQRQDGWLSGFKRRSPTRQATASFDQDPLIEQHEVALGAAFDAHLLRGTLEPDGEEVSMEFPDHSVAAKSAAAGELSDENNFYFDQLVERLTETPIVDRGRRVLITGFGDDAHLAGLARDFARSLATRNLTILIDAQPGSEGDHRPGLTDLLADEASFFSVIQRDSDTKLHHVCIGTSDPKLVHEEPEGLEIILSALEQTYEWVLVALPDITDEAAFVLLSGSVDSVVVASDDDPQSSQVQATYQAAQRAGASQVVVAAVGAMSRAAAA